ncbi:MAG: DUF3094 domain-containing protein [Gammaproteobacteria bacterium]|nr:DUF3094 domain-containing protein [Gammaproteobacteria bacterium]MBT8151497.1 DUF3094 domain-containing protein [Gammaproteobacteria bacterium]NNM11967.1 DUF3094 family protein [Pseudomonadales bacterium]
MGDLISRPEPKREAAAAKQERDGEAGEKLSAEDLERVARYLRSPVHQVERKPFRPWLMMLLLLATVGALSLLSLLISWLVL